MGHIDLGDCFLELLLRVRQVGVGTPDLLVSKNPDYVSAGSVPVLGDHVADGVVSLTESADLALSNAAFVGMSITMARVTSNAGELHDLLEASTIVGVGVDVSVGGIDSGVGITPAVAEERPELGVLVVGCGEECIYV